MLTLLIPGGSLEQWEFAGRALPYLFAFAVLALAFNHFIAEPLQRRHEAKMRRDRAAARAAADEEDREQAAADQLLWKTDREAFFRKYGGA